MCGAGNFTDGLRLQALLLARVLIIELVAYGFLKVRLPSHSDRNERTLRKVRVARYR